VVPSCREASRSKITRIADSVPDKPFDGIAISVMTRLRPESSSLECGLEALSAINENDDRFGLSIGFLDPIVDRFAAPIDDQSVE
jgi:hypothetical protein